MLTYSKKNGRKPKDIKFKNKYPDWINRAILSDVVRLRRTKAGAKKNRVTELQMASYCVKIAEKMG